MIQFKTIAIVAPVVGTSAAMTYIRLNETEEVDLKKVDLNAVQEV